jgi:replicative DNA helicase
MKKNNKNNKVVPITQNSDKIPNSLQLEKDILGILLVKPDLLFNTDHPLTTKDFYNQPHKLIYEKILNLHNNKEPIDIVTVSQALQEDNLLKNVGDRDYIIKLAFDVTTTAYYPIYTRKLKEVSIKRQTYYTLHELKQDILDNKPTETLLNVTRNINDNLNSLLIKNTKNWQDVVTESFDGILDRFESKQEFVGIDTGFKNLNSYLYGWESGVYYLIAGRPSMGKTAFALNLATNTLENDKRVLIFSAEMNEDQIIHRLLAKASKINSRKLKLSAQLGHEDFTRLYSAKDKILKYKLQVDTKSSPTPDYIRATIKKAIDNNKAPELIVIDYIGLMSDGIDTIKPKNIEIENISQNIKNIAKDFNVPIIALSQLSRAVEQRQNKRPMLSDLRDSGSLEQDADTVMFLYNDNY